MLESGKTRDKDSSGFRVMSSDFFILFGGVPINAVSVAPVIFFVVFDTRILSSEVSPERSIHGATVSRMYSFCTVIFFSADAKWESFVFPKATIR